MSITISTDVFCDICGNWFHGVTGPMPKIRRARQLAKSAGWRRYLSRNSSQLIDICPHCGAKQDKTNDG